MASCQNDEIVSNEQQQGNYSLKVSSLVDSRTYVENDGTVKWSKGDKLYVYGDNVSGVLTLQGEGGNPTGTFSGFVFGNPNNLEWAVFGDNVKGTTDGAQFTISEITDPNSNSPMVGAINNGSVNLEHLCGMVRITINGLPEGATVTLEGTGIAGTAEWDGENLTHSSKTNSITLKTGEGSDNTFEIPVFASETEEVKDFKLIIGGKECPFSAPIAINSLSEKAIMHITCITDANGNVTGFTQAASTKEALIQALQTEGTISFQLSDNITLDETVVVGENTNATIDLNGKTITGDWHKNNGHVIKNEGVLNLIGGTVKSTGNNGGSAVINNGTMTIEGTTLNGAPNADGSWPSYTINNSGSLTINDATITSYHGAVASYGENAVVTLNNSVINMSGIPGFTNHGIYTYGNGSVIVNGGTYVNNAEDQSSTGGSVINGAVTVNEGTFTGHIENYYGTPVLKGGTYSVNPNTGFIPEGYTVIKSGDKYHVIEGTDKNIKSVSDTETLKSVLKNASANDVIVLTSNITITGNWDNRTNQDGGTFTNAVVIEGLGNTLAFEGLVNDGGNYHSVFRFESDATVRNLTIDMSQATSNNNRARAISAKTNLTVDNCTFIGNKSLTTTRGIIYGEGNNDHNNSTIKITGCKFKNWKKGIIDNENAKDVESVEIDNNTFTNADVYISASDAIVFTNNVMNSSIVNIQSHSAANTAKVKVTGNTLYESERNVIGNSTQKFDSKNIEYQEGITANTL